MVSISSVNSCCNGNHNTALVMSQHSPCHWLLADCAAPRRLSGHWHWHRGHLATANTGHTWPQPRPLCLTIMLVWPRCGEWCAAAAMRGVSGCVLCPKCRLRSDSRAEYRLVWTEESDSATLLRPTQTAVTDTDLQYLLEKQILKTTFLPTDWWIVDNTLIIHCSLIRSNQYFYNTFIYCSMFIMFIFLLSLYIKYFWLLYAMSYVDRYLIKICLQF